MQRYRGEISRHRRPFWLPASNYYILAASVAIAFFFLVWGILNDGRDETPWIPAGIGAAIILSLAVIVREIVLRGRRNRFLISQRQIDQSVRGIAQRAQERDPAKLTLERNAAILREISRKSEAAKVLARFAEGHRDVFELCEEYLGVVRKELPRVAPGSPRLVALLRGTEVAGKYHYYHMLQWAEIESRTLTKDAGKRDKISEKLDSAQSALGVVEFALQSYPEDPALQDSQKVLVELVSSMKITDLIERAERLAFKGNHRRALSLYQDALFFLQRENPAIEGELVDHINEEISRIQGHLLDS
jgi:hypothetical protein